MTYKPFKEDFDFPHNKMLHQSVISIRGKDNTTCMRDTITFGYDEVGNLASIDRSGTVADMTYGYDLMHGWVKEITSTGGFEQRLYREDNTGHELYNGSISAMTWKVPGQNYVRRYDYTYDGMNRLVEGAYSHLRVFTPLPGIISSTGEDVLSMGGSSPLSLIPVIDALGGLVGPININATDRYTERIAYDKNSNITSLERYGMNNQRHYGLIDSLVITRNGNQLKTIEDYAEKDLTYTGASDFYDGLTNSTEYTYNANGALSKDMNRKIGYIGYDDLGHLRRILYHNGIANSIEYIYAADGTKLRTIHRGSGGLNAYVDSIDYVGNLILKNGQPKMYLFDGGYASFNNDTINGWHYYISDYMGNNRMVVNSNGTVEQITHYYPYGGVIGDISTNESVQKYKFEGKELDRSFGLDNYDIHARQYFAMMPSWDRIDLMAEIYYGISPYAYCGGDPVNKVDNDGKAIIFVNGFRPGVGCRDQVRYGYGNNSYPSVYDNDVADYWDDNIITYYKEQFTDNKTFFTSGSASPVSTAAQREEEGGIKALILDLMVADGKLSLGKDEPIRIVSHSQGGATAAGMAKTLLEYGYNVEIVEYITPHQATDFTHPDQV